MDGFEKWKKAVKEHTPKDNPFLLLFEDTETKGMEEPIQYGSSNSFTKFIEKIFCITLTPTKKFGVIFLDLEIDEGTDPKNEAQILIKILTKRLSMKRHDLLKSLMFADDDKDNNHKLETRPMLYLAESYLRCTQQSQDLSDQDEVTKSTLDAIKTAIIESTVKMFHLLQRYFHKDLTKQIIDTLDNYVKTPLSLSHWLEETYDSLQRKGNVQLIKPVIESVVFGLRDKIKETPLLSVTSELFEPLFCFARTPKLGQSFLALNMLPPNSSGRSYMETIIGSILSKSCLPSQPSLKYEHYDKEPSKVPLSAIDLAESEIHASLEIVHEAACKLLKSLLKIGPEGKHMILMWIGCCIKANKASNTLWNRQHSSSFVNKTASDGFMLNFGAVLLLLCRPFTEGSPNKNIWKIDPTYMAVKCKSQEDHKQKHVHLLDGPEEGFIVKSEEETTRIDQVKAEYNFITDIFFLTHKSLDLFIHPLSLRFHELSREVEIKSKSFNEMLGSDTQTPKEVANGMRKTIDSLMTPYYCLRSALLVPTVIDNVMTFCAATAEWMVQLSLEPENPRLSEVRKELRFPLNNEIIPPGLMQVPEFLVLNMYEYLQLIRSFSAKSLEKNGDYLPPFLDFILAFMGSPKWIKSPHVRAKLAAMLSDLLPIHRWSFDGSFYRVQLFLNHPHRLEIVPTLLKIFVHIEARSHHQTDTDVGDGFKYSYRSPIYTVMTYLLESDEYKEKLRSVAIEAEKHINDSEAPLFLKFVNFYINDAIFLLDESLDIMKRIQEEQNERENTWPNLLLHEQQERAVAFQRLEGWARACNRMSLQSITVLDKLTKEIKEVFTHSTLVDRMAGMLNHFLKSLVDPDKAIFSDSNKKDYNFYPGQVIRDICRIYVNFQESDAFFQAVSRDGRSYSSTMFSLALDVLLGAGITELLADLQMVESKVKQAAENAVADEEAFAEAPDQYLDAILSHLMTDPVRLPNSGQVVDRSTIARHLLSDQNDPFTRAPLTMEDVEPMDELRVEIQSWMASRRVQN